MVTVDTSATSVESLPKHPSTLGRQSIDMLVACRLSVAIDISTDASVDVSVQNHFDQIECCPFMQFCATAKCFKSTLYLLLCPTEKLPFGSLFYVQNDLNGSPLPPCCLHQATTVQHFSFQFPEPSAICMLRETAVETWRRSFALIIAVKCCQ